MVQTGEPNSPGAARNTTTIIIIISPERLGHPRWRAPVNVLNDSFAIDWVVVDETHLIFGAKSTFRPLLLEMGARIAIACHRKLFTTATLPPALEADFRSVYNLATSAKIVRASTSRPQITFRNVAAPTPSTCKARLIDLVARFRNSNRARAAAHTSSREPPRLHTTIDTEELGIPPALLKISQ
ncbi:hypothetical protein LX36DRAFT_754552 [Colletotrichum falcatum]|nr:hypothetical protein LX36DRAFT_754552 [Colletotrichum falcatum]